jgi:hypothetical protein
MKATLLWPLNSSIAAPASGRLKLLFLIAFFCVGINLYAGASPVYKKAKAGVWHAARAAKHRQAAVLNATQLTVSYSNPHVYVTGTAISPLAPATTGVAPAAYSTNPIGITGLFGRPRAEAVDVNGNVYVCDFHYGVI